MVRWGGQEKTLSNETLSIFVLISQRLRSNRDFLAVVGDHSLLSVGEFGMTSQSRE